MSFILDALKKSDQERQRRTAPSIHTDQAATTEQRWERRRLWPYLVVPVLLLNAGLLLWWLHPWESGKPDVKVAETHTKGPVSRTSPADGASKAAPTDRADLAAAPDRPRAAAQQSGRAKRRELKPEQSVIASSLDAEDTPRRPRQNLTDAHPGRSTPEKPMHEQPKAAPDRLPPKMDVKKAPDSLPKGIAQTAQAPPAKPSSPETVEKSTAKLDGGDSPSASVQANSAAPSAVGPPADRLGRSESAAGPDMNRKAAREPKPESKSEPESKPEPRPESKLKPASESKPKSETKPEPKLRPQPKPEPAEALALSGRANTALPDRQTSATQPKAVGEELKSILDADQGSEKGVLQFHKLPFPVRQAMPNLSLSMLIYAQNPADRMVGVNGHVRREGQQVDTGLKLERITPNGAVFSFQGYLFYKGVL